MGFKTNRKTGNVFNDNKQRSDKHHGSVKPESGVKIRHDNGLTTIKFIGIGESLGIDTNTHGLPLDSIIEGGGENYKIVGYRSGATFSSESLKHIAPNMKKYLITVESDPDSDYGSYYAKDDKIAKRLVKESLKEGTKFKLWVTNPSVKLVR